MLHNRAEISEDKSFDLVTEAILQRDQPRIADLFYGMVVRDGRSIGDALSVVVIDGGQFRSGHLRKGARVGRGVKDVGATKQPEAEDFRSHWRAHSSTALPVS